MLPMTQGEKDALAKAARLLRDLGASQVYMFGSAVKGQLRPDSDIDMAVSGLPPGLYFCLVGEICGLTASVSEPSR